MVISDRVFAKWRDLSSRTSKPDISLWVPSVSESPLSVVVAVEEVVQEALAALAESQGDDPATYPRFAHAVAAPGGVIIEVGRGIEGFESFVSTIAEGLSAREFEGTIELFEPMGLGALPFTVPLIECRIRVAGWRDPENRIRWRAEPDAWRGLISAGVHWCAAGGAVDVTFGTDTTPRVALSANDDLASLILDAAGRDEIGVFFGTAGGRDHWRMIVAMPFGGRVSLVEAGPDLRPRNWVSAVAELSQFLSVNRGLLVYAFIKQGSDVQAAWSGYSLAEDWPARPGFNALARLESSFEEAYAPDAFAVQMLGPGFTGRVPQGPSWRETKLEDGFSLVESIRPELWFDHDFIPAAAGPVRAREIPPPPVLQQAREDFGRVLFRDEIFAAG